MDFRKVRTTKEKEDMFSIRMTVFVDEQKVSKDIELDEFDETAIHFVGYKKEKPIAAARVRFIEDYGKLERICVLQNYRGKHFGIEIVRELEKEVEAQGYKKAKLNAQTHAKTFYEKLGYQVASEEFLDAGIPHITMIKQLEG